MTLVNNVLPPTLFTPWTLFTSEYGPSPVKNVPSSE